MKVLQLTDGNRSSSAFYPIARKHNTDKVSDHTYEHTYEKYLDPIRHKPLKFLEIGLGCDAKHGPGRSLELWLEYMPNVDLYFLEYDADCAKKWEHMTKGKATIYTGDQADIKVLEKIVRDSGGNFDVVIDDGGHGMEQQIHSLLALWHAVKPGGLYFVEDLQTSYWTSYGGGDGGEGTTVGLLKDILGDLMHTGGHADMVDSKFAFSKEVLFLDCGVEICAFGKRPIEDEGKDRTW